MNQRLLCTLVFLTAFQPNEDSLDGISKDVDRSLLTRYNQKLALFSKENREGIVFELDVIDRVCWWVLNQFIIDGVLTWNVL